jgi:hypothetical protein
MYLVVRPVRRVIRLHLGERKRGGREKGRRRGEERHIVSVREYTDCIMRDNTRNNTHTHTNTHTSASLLTWLPSYVKASSAVLRGNGWLWLEIRMLEVRSYPPSDMSRLYGFFPSFLELKSFTGRQSGEAIGGSESQSV